MLQCCRMLCPLQSFRASLLHIQALATLPPYAYTPGATNSHSLAAFATPLSTFERGMKQKRTLQAETTIGVRRSTRQRRLVQQTLVAAGGRASGSSTATHTAIGMRTAMGSTRGGRRVWRCLPAHPPAPCSWLLRQLPLAPCCQCSCSSHYALLGDATRLVRLIH